MRMKGDCSISSESVHIIWKWKIELVSYATLKLKMKFVFFFSVLFEKIEDLIYIIT